MLEVRASLLGLALAVTALASHAQSGAAAREWLAYAGDAASTKYSSLAQIDESNVARLEVAWRQPSIEYPAGETLRASLILETTPLYASGRLLISSAAGMGAALDPTTGERLWVYDPYDVGDKIDRTSYEFRNRGGAFWRGEGKERFLLLSNGYLVSLDAATGKPDRSFGEEGLVDMRKAVDPPLDGYSWSSAPTVCGDTLVLGSSTHDSSMHQKAPPGLIQAYDIPTGELLWVFHIIPRKGEPGYETWEEGSADYTGAGNVWGWFSCDADLDMVYANTSTPNNDWYGGHRPGAGLYGESIVALRTRTGERVWHFQAIHHGLWDYDFPAAPVLTDITVDGREIKALVAVSKQAYAYVLDRETGEPVWPIVELPAPPSTVPGEQAYPTQPHPSWPKAYDLQGLAVEDLIDLTPELRRAAMQRLEGYQLGPLYLPPALLDGERFRGAVQVPSAIGATAWNGAALDPETQILYVPSVTALLVIDLDQPDPNRSDFRYRHGGPRTGHIQLEGGLPITKPPWGRITAIDMNTGEHLWVAANGDGPKDHPLLAGLDLPALGQTGRASPLVTKTLLFLGEGSPDMIAVPQGGGGPMFRAFDKATGDVVWETELPAGVTSAPMTYEHEGKQYIVVAFGDRTTKPEFIAFVLGDLSAAR